ncbi:MAG: hypothetical protein FWB95_08265 [Treponema sp.]|nr:hypothetical protein [Treponema sp.]
MKNVFLSALLVLVLSLAILSCKDDEALFPEDFPDGLVSALEGMGVPSFLGPEGVTFDDWAKNGDEIYIAWKDADTSKFDAYVNAWKNESTRAVVNEIESEDISNKFNNLSVALICYYEAGGTLASFVSFEIEAYSIVFMGKK